jgi:hypothetical protein
MLAKCFRFKPRTINKIQWILENSNEYMNATDIAESGIDIIYNNIKNKSEQKLFETK